MPDLTRYYAPQDVKRWSLISLGIGGLGTLVVIGATLVSKDVEQALRSWLLGFIFWAGIGIGCLGILQLQYLTGGAWGVVSRRVLEAAARTLPLLVLLFIPLALGVATRTVYNWTHLDPNEHVMQQ